MMKGFKTMQNLQSGAVVEVRETGLVMKVISNNGVTVDCEFLFAPITRTFELANDELRFLSDNKDLSMNLEPNLKAVIAKRNDTLVQIIANLNKPKTKRPPTMDEEIVRAKSPDEVKEILKRYGIT